MTRPSRVLSASSVGRGLAEVVLIFVGITLAIGFENWNAENEERQIERELLDEVRLNLIDNQLQLDTLILGAMDLTRAMESVAVTLEEDLPWTDESLRALGRLDNWPSPFLVTSAWETLRARGLTLIEDRELRRDLVTVYEETYAFIVGDVDRAQWEEHASAIYPLRAEYMREVIREDGRVYGLPIDDARLRADGRVAAVARSKATTWRRVIEIFVAAQGQTTAMVDYLGESLDSQVARPVSVLENPETFAAIERFRAEKPLARLDRSNPASGVAR